MLPEQHALTRPTEWPCGPYERRWLAVRGLNSEDAASAKGPGEVTFEARTLVRAQPLSFVVVRFLGDRPHARLLKTSTLRLPEGIVHQQPCEMTYMEARPTVRAQSLGFRWQWNGAQCQRMQSRGLP